MDMDMDMAHRMHKKHAFDAGSGTACTCLSSASAGTPQE